jgi:peptidoglycan/LPS O-acetylase OafA/YrhL
MRMVAVLLVIANHLFGWPRGGFIGVDVFFVISGFLITGLLLREFDATGRISFASFYRRRIRRIVPIATLVLVVTCVAVAVVFSATRASSTWLDALWAFLFVANWRFAVNGTDYFQSAGPASPIQHYWSLSVEEQFYFVWPALILVIGLVVTRRAWSGTTKRQLSAGVMGVIVVASFGWALHETSGNPTWAYFSTLTRVWELGVGAFVAIAAGLLARLPASARPVIAWTGLVAIAGGAFAITEGSGFPAPGAALPVVGAALVLGAGVAGDFRFLQVLTNRASVYVGNISYSLYLWHWPVIVVLGSLMDGGAYYYATVLPLTLGLSIGSYHLLEDPVRHSMWLEPKAKRRQAKVHRKWESRRPWSSATIQTASLMMLALLTAALTAYAIEPPESPTAPPERTALAAAPATASTAPQLGPSGTTLRGKIDAAVGARDWPSDLNPTIGDAIGSHATRDDVSACGGSKAPDRAKCTWGAPSAPRTVMILGDSVAMTYVEPLKNFAEVSGGQWKVRTEAMFGCTFVDITIRNSDAGITDACPQRKSQAISDVKSARPDVVVISNTYEPRTNSDTNRVVTPDEWAAGLQRLTSQFAGDVGKIVFLSPPPSDKNISDCYTKVHNPADCISRVTNQWASIAGSERGLAAASNGLFVDSRPWFCTLDNFCPSFVGTTPTKLDLVHMTPRYADDISPAFAESLKASGALVP